jgi:exosortase A
MESASGNAVYHRVTWAAVLPGLAIVLVVLLWLFFPTLWSLVSIWLRSDTYAHGAIVLPISLWLIWEKRAGLAGSVPRPTLVPALLMLPVGGVWLLGSVTDVLVVQQYGFICLLILAIWSMVGTPVTRFLAFPLGFLLLAVPVGESLTYPLMNFTADFTVGLLRLTGIPVYRDGTFFSLPSGDWSVVEECSGVRYLLASVTLGILFAYLNFRFLWKRLVFVLFSVVVPVFANGLRAYLIVMIGHLSNMKLATGIDHLIYGWVFFGVVIAIMFWFGSMWRDPVGKMPAGLSGGGGARGVGIVGVAVLSAAGIWPGLMWGWERVSDYAEMAVALQVPTAVGDWQETSEGLWSWRPRVVAPDGEVYVFYRGLPGTVGVYLGVFRSQRQGAELVSSANQMVSTRDQQWSDKEISTRAIRLPTGQFTVNQSRLVSRHDGDRLLVWNWYRIGDVSTSSPYRAKLVEAAYRLWGGERAGTLIAVAAPYRVNDDEAAAVLEGFLAVMLPSLEAEIARAIAAPP